MNLGQEFLFDDRLYDVVVGGGLESRGAHCLLERRRGNVLDVAFGPCQLLGLSCIDIEAYDTKAMTAAWTSVCVLD